jgi:hypothetical protein
MTAAIWCVALGSLSAQTAAPLMAIVTGGRMQPLARLTGTIWTPLDPACVSSMTGLDRTKVSAVAASPGVQVDAVHPIPAGSIPRAVRAAIVRMFDERMRGQRLEAERLTSVPLVVDALYGSPAAGGVRVYYFEASKSVPDVAADVDPDDPRGTLRPMVNGWLRETNGRTDSLGASSELGWIQLDDSERTPPRQSDLVPLGILKTNTGEAWIMRVQTGANPRFTIYDTGGSRVRTLVDARAAC